MTAGALIQIKNGYADRMAFLTLNPQISYFLNQFIKDIQICTRIYNIITREKRKFIR